MPKRRAHEKPSADEARVDPAHRGRPWWLLAVVVAIVTGVIAMQFGDGKRTEGQDIEEIEIDALPAPPERLRVHVVRTYPHDTDAFTQGLLWHDGAIYESTGLRHRSTLRRVDLTSGEVRARRDLAPQLFAEGLALVGDRLVQLTWTSGEAHVWSLEDFRHRQTFHYEGEGWGLCYDGEHLVMSNGSAELTFRDPETFRVVRRVTVRDAGRPVRELNELECADGLVWANVWQTDRIVRIDPRTGRVTGVVDASGLLTDDERRGTDVLNGIAWIPERHHFVITGKLWPRVFEVEFLPQEDRP